jgi:hypothetical protein
LALFAGGCHDDCGVPWLTEMKIGGVFFQKWALLSLSLEWEGNSRIITGIIGIEQGKVAMVSNKKFSKNGLACFTCQI